MAPWAYPEPYAAAAPLGPAARSRVRGADSLAQALDLLANPHRIVDDRRLGDQTRVVQVALVNFPCAPNYPGRICR